MHFRDTFFVDEVTASAGMMFRSLSFWILIESEVTRFCEHARYPVRLLMTLFGVVAHAYPHLPQRHCIFVVIDV